MIRLLIQFIRISRYSPTVIWKNIYYNFISKNIIRDNNSYIYIFPHVIIQLSKESRIILKGTLHLGIPSIRNNKQVSKLLMNGNSEIIINNKCELLDGFDIQIHNNGTFQVENFHSNVNLEVSCGNSIRLEGEVTAGRHVHLKDFNGHFVSYDNYPISSPIRVENHVWLCTGCTISPGVTIHSGSVISDNSNVINDIPSDSFCQGNPASIVKNNIKFNI